MLPKHGHAYLHLIHGPMMSSKTTTLVSLIQKLIVLDRRVLVINHELDTRSDVDVIRTHDGLCLGAKKVRSLVRDVRDSDLSAADVVAVDEAQFFSDLVPAVTSWLALDKYVIVAGLCGDAHQKKFGQLLDLFLVADEITSLRAFCNVCKDGTPAAFTMFRDEPRSQGQVEVGGCEKYIAVCRKHLRSAPASV